MSDVPRREERRLQDQKRKKGKQFKKEGPKFRMSMMKQLLIARDLEEEYEQQNY